MKPMLSVVAVVVLGLVAIPGRVVEDGEQPRPQVGSRLEAAGGPERLEVGFLDQIFSISRVTGETQSRAVQTVQIRQSLAVERGGRASFRRFKPSYAHQFRAP